MRLIDITLKLAENRSSFCGHSENIGDDCNSNFVAEAEYDNILKRAIDIQWISNILKSQNSKQTNSIAKFDK